MSNTYIYGLALKTNKKKSGNKDILEMKQRSDISKRKHPLGQPEAQNKHLREGRCWYDSNQERQK